MESKVVTIKDIARDLDVSLTTVHKVIYNKKGASDKTRERVLSYIQESGFRINQAASALKRHAIRLAYVGLAPTEANRFFFEKVSEGVREAYETLKSFNVELETRITPEDADAQCAVLEELLDGQEKAPLDGLLLTCCHELRCTPMIRKFTDAGIPVVTVSSDAKNSTRRSFVGADSVTVGRVAGEMMVDLGIPQNGQVLLISGYREFSNHQMVSSAFAEYLNSERSDVEILDIYQSHELKGTENKIRKYLEAFPGISSAYSATARGTFALCSAIQDAGLSGRLKVVGTDVFEELRPFFANRTITATIFQDPRKQASQALASLYYLITREKTIPEEQFVNVSLAIRNNFDDFLF